MKTVSSLITAITILLIATVSTAQALPAPEISVTPQQVKPGEDLSVTIKIPLKTGLHIYGPQVNQPYYKTTIKTNNNDGITWKKPIFPKTSTLNFMGENLQVIAPDENNNIIIKIVGTVGKAVASGQHDISLSITYQACSETTCFPPLIDHQLKTHVNIINGRQATPAAKEKVEVRVSFFNHSIVLSRTSLLSALLVAFIAGLIMNIMPCVLPIIPLKIMQIVNQAKSENRSPVLLSLLFAFGIILFFIVIGIAAVILRGSFSWGAQFQNTTFLIAMILLLVWLAIGMFGAFEIVVPNVLAGGGKSRGGYIGALSMGFLGGILSTPCSFGILGAAVAWAQAQSPTVTMLTFFTIGLGMSSPYIIISGFPKLVNKIPKAGRWSELFKQSMGFIILAVAAFLISVLAKDMLLRVLLYCLTFGIAVWFWGAVLQFNPKIWAKIAKLLLLAVLVLIGFKLLKTPAPPVDTERFSKTTLQQAISTKKPVIVDFTADWCMSCKFVDAYVYQTKEIKNLVKTKQIIILKADLTHPNPYATTKLKQWTGQSGLPYSVLITPSGKRVKFAGKFRLRELLDEIKKIH